MTTVWNEPSVSRGMNELLLERQAQLASGAIHRGWKAAMTSPTAMARVGVSGPLIGHFTDQTVHAPGVTMTVTELANPVAEAEVAVLMGSSLAAGSDRPTAYASIAGLAPAIEVAAGSPDLLDDVEALLAANIFHVAMIFPDEFAYDIEALDDLRVSQVSPDGTFLPEGGVRPRNPVEIIQHTASYLAAFGLALSEGDVIMSGSIMAPTPLLSGDTVSFDFGSFGTVAVSGG